MTSVPLKTPEGSHKHCSDFAVCLRFCRVLPLDPELLFAFNCQLDSVLSHLRRESQLVITQLKLAYGQAFLLRIVLIIG